MLKTESSAKEHESICVNEMSQGKVIEGGEQQKPHQYRILAEDEINELRRNAYNWSDRMKEECNFLYKLKYSQGIITPSFVQAVIESLEASDDFEITSFGHSKFILFIAGNQPPMRKDIDRKWPYNQAIDGLRKNALKRLEHRNFLVLDSKGYSCLISKSGKGWILSEEQRNTLPVTLKPDLMIWFRTWEERKIRRLKEKSHA